MMLLVLLILLIPGLSQAQTAHDLILQVRSEKAALTWVAEKTRLIMNNAEVDDPWVGESTLDAPPRFFLEEITQDPEVHQFRDAFSKIFKTELKSAYVRLRIPKIYYQIDQLLVDPKSLNVVDPNFILDLNVGLRGLTVRLTEGIAADIMIPNPTTGSLESFLTAQIEPIHLHIPRTLDPLPFGVEFVTKINQGFKFELKSTDTSRIPNYVESHKSSLQIQTVANQESVDTRHIKINPVVVRLNHLSRTVSFDELKPVLQKRMPALVSRIFSLLGNSLDKTLGPRLLKMVFSNGTHSDLMVSNDHIYTRYSTAQFIQPVPDQFAFGIRGDLCTSKTFRIHGDLCIHQEPKFEPIRSISPEDRTQGFESISKALAKKRADFVISISEDYINRLLKTTIDADLWSERLSEDHLSLGPKGVFTVFNRETQQPDLFIDLYYSGDQGVEKLLINERKPIRFPLRLSTSISFVSKNGVPHLIIKTEKLLSDANEIIRGIPEYELESRLVRLFQKKIAKMIIKMAKKLEGQTAIDLDFPVMREVGLDQTTYEITPFGRLNWFFRL